ncbi:small nuclear ribonucleoprotein [Phyllosticta citriasiana]|uniref:Sm protein B n=1 Tax=Phyllosticta citriasiana TaxID=595635 RepID=A0ABR1KUT7_9PEZI
MAQANKQGKMVSLINYRMRATLSDGRQMAGQMLAFDKHMNLVLADTEEFRRVKRKSTKSQAPGAAAAPLVEAEEKRTLGLTIVRGNNIVSLSVEGPPPADPSTRLGTGTPGGAAAAAATLASGPGISKPAGRGLPVGLTGPAAGVGGPGPAGFGSFPPPQGGFPGAPGAPPGFPGRGGPAPGAPGFPPQGFPGGAPPGFPPGFQPPPGGRGFPGGPGFNR